jgi:hypothetical protein
MSADPCDQTLVATWTWRCARFLLSAILICQAHGYAQLGPQQSAVNRALAFYRHIIGIHTDQERPAAR